MMISARNQIDTIVEKVEKGAVNSTIVLKSAKGLELTATITNRSVNEMGIKAGDRSVTFFKASHVLIATDWVMAISARNKLNGSVESVRKGSVSAEVIVRLESGDRLMAVISNRAVDDLRIQEGMSVTAIIKASDVMIAK